MLPVILTFAITLLILAWLSNRVSIHLQLFLYQITRSQDLSMVLYFLIFMPGVFVHEVAHWGMARALGLQTGKFSVWPKRKGRYIQLGSVAVQRGGVWLDSLVGMAPLILGSIVLGFMSHRVFNAYQITDAFATGRFSLGIDALFQALNQPDSALWIYFIFVIGNAMMPSITDRQPLKPLFIYLLIATVIYLFIGLPLGPIQSVFEIVAQPLADLSSAFIFISILDFAVLIVLLILELLTKPRG